MMPKLPVHMQHALPKPVETKPFDPARELDELTELAMAQKRKILGMRLPLGKDGLRDRQLILSAADSTINQKIKVDEVSMRQQQNDGLPALLERMAKAIKGE